MFLKNERGMGVKNGTLATIQRVSPDRMAVRLDDGREVAFDVKDYAHVDHGYAATFHKAQGVTVEGAHVLATPGMDRHSAYVGLSRHRDDVQLHYGHDDFGDQDRLVRTLSRERAKDMASDYSRDFAERCGIDATDRLDSAAVRDQIIQRHARTVSAIFQMQEQGRDLLPEQVPALQASRKELNKLDPHAAVDIERAYKADPPLAHEAAGGRTARAIRAMRLEAKVRENPALRADRFVDRWRKLEAQREGACQKGDYDGMRRIRDSMGAMAKGLERDPQLEFVLATRKQALGLHFERDPSIGRSLAMSIGFDMGRGLGIGM